MRRRFTWFNATALTLGFAFLYLPILILVAYSFNASRLVPCGAAFSTRWYRRSCATRRSSKPPGCRFDRPRYGHPGHDPRHARRHRARALRPLFRGRSLFTGMVYAPMGHAGGHHRTGAAPAVCGRRHRPRLLDRDARAHDLRPLLFVTVIVQARLVISIALGRGGQDLGAPPVRTFVSVTLPLIAPAVVAGFLLAFTLSLDDLVIASFTSGPCATTLPMRIYSQVSSVDAGDQLPHSTNPDSLVTIVVLAATSMTSAPHCALHRRRGRSSPMDRGGRPASCDGRMPGTMGRRSKGR